VVDLQVVDLEVVNIDIIHLKAIDMGTVNWEVLQKLKLYLSVSKLITVGLELVANTIVCSLRVGQ